MARKFGQGEEGESHQEVRGTGSFYNLGTYPGFLSLKTHGQGSLKRQAAFECGAEQADQQEPFNCWRDDRRRDRIANWHAPRCLRLQLAFRHVNISC